MTEMALVYAGCLALLLLIIFLAKENTEKKIEGICKARMGTSETCGMPVVIDIGEREGKCSNEHVRSRGQILIVKTVK